METNVKTVIAGVDTHKDSHVLCILDILGKKIYEGVFPASKSGYQKLAEAIGDPSHCQVVGIEGTCSFGAGLTMYLIDSGFEVVEVLRPKRDRRRRGSQKNDFIDAERAARAAIARNGVSIPKSRDGWAETARPALRSREILVHTQTKIMNAAKSLINTAPEEIRTKYVKLNGVKLMKALKRRRPVSGKTDIDMLMMSLSSLAGIWLDAEEKAAELEFYIEQIVREKAPAVLEIAGCGALSAVELGLAAGDNPNRMNSEASFAMLCGASPIEASSGRSVRHRLNRGGNRQANRALHSIVLSRMRSDERTSNYIAKRISEGKSKREAMRCLKRYVAREVYRALRSPMETRYASGPSLAAKRKSFGLLQRDVADKLGVASEVISSIETERAKHLETRIAYEAFLNSVKNY